MWKKVDISKDLCVREHQLFFEMMEGYEASCIKISIFCQLIRGSVFFDILHTLSPVKTSKTVAKSAFF